MPQEKPRSGNYLQIQIPITRGNEFFSRVLERAIGRATRNNVFRRKFKNQKQRIYARHEAWPVAGNYSHNKEEINDCRFLLFGLLYVGGEY